MNHCDHCGKVITDNFLVSEPLDPFNPVDYNDVKNIEGYLMADSDSCSEIRASIFASSVLGMAWDDETIKVTKTTKEFDK